MAGSEQILWNLDGFFIWKISDKKRNDIENSTNLTYLAVKESNRNKGIGRLFIENILKKHFRNEFISVETDNKQTLNFYINQFIQSFL